MSIHIMANSEGYSLRFNNDLEDAQFETERHELYMRTYHKEVMKYGIYASNQDKYVKNVFQLNEWDNRKMYSWYINWLEKEHDHIHQESKTKGEDT